jgi:putative ATP-binding cassette transporter
MLRQKKLTWFQSFYGQLAVIFPYVVVAPRYFSNAIPLGGLMQTGSAFGQVQGSMSWFIDAYARLADWKATVDRLIGFHAAMVRTEREAREHPGISRDVHAGDDIRVTGVNLALPDGRLLVADINRMLPKGQSVLLTGASGSGKSTLFRVLAGIWPFGSGKVAVPSAASVLFLPQRPYLPVDTLRAALSYPSASGTFADAELEQALADCGLDHFHARLDELQNWALMLSGGEQQRIAFARALLHAPDWLFLDEATSALDEAMERRMYALLSERMPATTVVSVGHRPSLAEFHEARLVIERDPSGMRHLVAVAS